MKLSGSLGQILETGDIYKMLCGYTVVDSWFSSIQLNTPGIIKAFVRQVTSISEFEPILGFDVIQSIIFFIHFISIYVSLPG